MNASCGIRHQERLGAEGMDYTNRLTYGLPRVPFIEMQPSFQYQDMHASPVAQRQPPFTAVHGWVANAGNSCEWNRIKRLKWRRTRAHTGAEPDRQSG